MTEEDITCMVIKSAKKMGSILNDMTVSCRDNLEFLSSSNAALVVLISSHLSTIMRVLNLDKKEVLSIHEKIINHVNTFLNEITFKKNDYKIGA